MSNVFALTNNERDTTKIINELNSLLLRKETNKDTNEVSFIIPTSQWEPIKLTYNNVKELALNDIQEFFHKKSYEIIIINEKNDITGSILIEEGKKLTLDEPLAFTDESEEPPFRVVYQIEIDDI